MPKQALVSMTEPMLYILMALRDGPKCGIDIADIVSKRTNKRVSIGPATLYTLLGKFEDADYIVEIDKDQPGRKRTYAMTRKGVRAYAEEIRRLQACLKDAKEVESELAIEQGSEYSSDKARAERSKLMEEKYRNPGL